MVPRARTGEGAGPQALTSFPAALVLPRYATNSIVQLFSDTILNGLLTFSPIACVVHIGSVFSLRDYSVILN